MPVIDEVRAACRTQSRLSRSHALQADLEQDTAFAVAIESDEEEWID